MLQGTIIRGTTPKHEFELSYPQEFVKDVRVSYGQNNQSVLTKTLAECKLMGNVLSIDLTQEETFLFSPEKRVAIEIRVQLIDGAVIRNEEPIELRVLDTLNGEVFE